jgi:glycosyltransferase involved in cell wall biosynthesis
LVSIIIPTYNCRRWIAEAIDSALAQTYPQCEIIVVDDGSTDGTGKYLRERYGERIRYIYQPNRGRGAARNHGLRLACGKYIQFLDADDLILPGKIGGQVAFLEAHPGYAAVYCHCLVFNEDDKAHRWDWPRQKAYCSGDILEREIHEPYLLPNMVLVRRQWVELVGGFDEELRSNEDWDLWLRIAYAGGQFKYLPGPAQAMYRRTQWHSQQQESLHWESGVIVLKKLASIMTRDEKRRLDIAKAIGHWQFHYGRSIAQEGSRWGGVVQMAKGLLRDQRHFEAKLATLVLTVTLGSNYGNRVFASLRRLKGALQGVNAS